MKKVWEICILIIHTMLLTDVKIELRIDIMEKFYGKNTKNKIFVRTII